MFTVDLTTPNHLSPLMWLSECPQNNHLPLSFASGSSLIDKSDFIDHFYNLPSIQFELIVVFYWRHLPQIFVRSSSMFALFIQLYEQM